MHPTTWYLHRLRGSVVICGTSSLHDDWPSAKGPGLSEGAYMLVILSISVVIVFVSLLALS